MQTRLLDAVFINFIPLLCLGVLRHLPRADEFVCASGGDLFAFGEPGDGFDFGGRFDSGGLSAVFEFPDAE